MNWSNNYIILGVVLANLHNFNPMHPHDPYSEPYVFLRKVYFVLMSQELEGLMANMRRETEKM